MPTLVLGRKLYSLIHLCVHLFNKHFSYSWSSGDLETVDCPPSHFYRPPPYLKLPRLGFCHIIPKMAFEKSSVASYQSSYSLSGCSVGFRTIFCLLELYALGSLFFWWPVAHSFNWIVFYIFTQEQRFYEEISLSPILLSLSTVSLPEGTHLFPPVSFSFTYHS